MVLTLDRLLSMQHEPWLETVHLSQLPCWEHLADEEYRARIADLVSAPELFRDRGAVSDRITPLRECDFALFRLHPIPSLLRRELSWSRAKPRSGRRRRPLTPPARAETIRDTGCNSAGYAPFGHPTVMPSRRNKSKKRPRNYVRLDSMSPIVLNSPPWDQLKIPPSSNQRRRCRDGHQRETGDAGRGAAF